MNVGKHTYGGIIDSIRLHDFLSGMFFVIRGLRSYSKTFNADFKITNGKRGKIIRTKSRCKIELMSQIVTNFDRNYTQMDITVSAIMKVIITVNSDNIRVEQHGMYKFGGYITFRLSLYSFPF